MNNNLTYELAAFVADLKYKDLPQHVRQRAEDITLDAVANALAGHQGEQFAQMLTFAQALGKSEESSVIGGPSLSLCGATFLNGYLVNAVTLADVHRPSFCNVTPEVIPSAFAISERLGASGEELLLAIAAGLEVATRIGLGVNYPVFRARGWHAPGIIGSFGGAVAAAKLMHLDADTLRHSIGLSVSQAAGTFAAWGTPTVKFHQARGAMAGLMAALLAEQGIVSAPEPLTHSDGGFYNTYSDGGIPDAVLSGLGRCWELENITLRKWPGAHPNQSLLTGLFALIEAHDLRPEQIRHVRVGVSEPVYKMYGALGWDNMFHALISTRFLTAVVLHDRRLWLDQFTPQRIRDANLGTFARDRITVEIDPSVVGDGAAVEVTNLDGKVYVERRKVGKGDPADPLTRLEIQEKFRIASESILSQAASDSALNLLNDLASVECVGQLFAFLRPHKA